MADANLEPREQFKSIFKADLFVTNFRLYIYEEKLDLQDHEPEKNILKLNTESHLLDMEEEGFPRKDYLICADDESRICSLYCGHLLLDRTDENTQVLESQEHHKKKCFVAWLLSENQRALPPLDYPGFLNGEINLVFWDLEQKPIRTSPEDYSRIRSWQTHKNLECVNLLFLDIRRRFMQGLENDPSLTDHLKLAIQQISDLVRNAGQMTADQLYHDLYLLRGIAPGSLARNKEEFYRLFCSYFTGKDFYHTMWPPEYRAFLEAFGKGKISNALIFCWTLRKFKKWVSDMLDGKKDFYDTTICNCGQVFEQIVERALPQSGELVAEFKARHPAAGLSEKDYKHILLREMKKCRKDYNRLYFPNYFQLIDVIENAKTWFVDHCFLDGDLENHGSQLQKAIELKEMIRFLNSELGTINKKLTRLTMNIPDIESQFADLISAMVPDRELSDQSWRAFTRAHRDLLEGKPGVFTEKALIKVLKDILGKALNRLNQRLSSMTRDIVILYADLQLEKLEVLALKSSGFKGFLRDFLLDLIKLLKDKRKLASHHLNVNLSQIGILAPDVQKQDFEPEPTSKPRSKPTKLLSFNYNNIKDDKLTLVLKALVKLKAISPNTTLPQFRRLFNGQEVTEPMEWWASQGDLMVFIKEMVRINDQDFASYNQHWNIAVKCFVQKGGMAFDAQKLRFSKPTNREQEFIEAARKFK